MSRALVLEKERGLRPSFELPRGACDSHFHVFGPVGRYPAAKTARYDPPDEALEAYLHLMRNLGFERFVFVQPSVYGIDNACMLDAMRQLDPAVRRGVVDVDELSTSDAELADLHKLGVRALRVNVATTLPRKDGLAAVMKPRILRLAKLARELGWHLDFLSPGWLLLDLLPTLRELDVKFSIGHFGVFAARDGMERSGFAEFLQLVADGSGRCWMKLSGPYRCSDADEFSDLQPFAEALIAQAPGQLLWGSDFPYLSFEERVVTTQLVNKLQDWAPDPALRQKILVENPARLFGFN